MKSKKFLVAVLTLVGAIAAAASTGRDGRTYTLYRDSPIGRDMRLHIATFDANESEDYNRENCVLGGQLFQAQPGVTARYWCEKGRFKK